jgi:hypothetical protein
MRGLSPASRLQAERMVRAPMAGAHPCPTVEYTILPETCANRQQAWLVDHNPARKCIGPDCPRFSVEFPALPEPAPLSLPFPEEEPVQTPVKVEKTEAAVKTCACGAVLWVGNKSGRCRKCHANTIRILNRKASPPKVCACGKVLSRQNKTGRCLPCNAPFNSPHRPSDGRPMKKKEKGPDRRFAPLGPGPAENLFTRLSDGAVLDRHGHKHHPCPGEGCTRWISTRASMCPSCSKRGVPKPKLTAVLKAGHAAVKKIYQENQEAPVAVFTPPLPATFGQMIPKDPNRTGAGFGPLQNYRHKLDTERIIQEYPDLLRRIERLEAALFRIGGTP